MKAEEGISTDWMLLVERGVADYCRVFVKKLLVAMIDKGFYLSQQTFESGRSDRDYPIWLELVFDVFLARIFHFPAF